MLCSKHLGKLFGVSNIEVHLSSPLQLSEKSLTISTRAESHCGERKKNNVRKNKELVCLEGFPLKWACEADGHCW